MLKKRAFLLFVVTIGLACESVSAQDAKPHGNRVLIEESSTLLVMDPSGTSPRKIAENVGAAALSPDGNLVAYVADKALRVLSLSDGQSVIIARLDDGFVQTLAWSPDQRSIAYDLQLRMKSWDLYLASYPPSGAAPRDLGHWYETVSFSPNGKFIVHPSFNDTGPPGHPDILETVSVQTGKREKIYTGVTTIWDARYSPDGSSIAFMMTDPADNNGERDSGGSVTDLWLLHLDTKKAVKIMPGVWDFDWSPDGRFLAIGKGTEVGDYPPDDGAVFISSVDGKVQFKISKDAPSLRAKFAPDSKAVMFVDFNASRFVVGNISTRKLTPVAGSGAEGGYEYLVCDWK